MESVYLCAWISKKLSGPIAYRTRMWIIDTENDGFSWDFQLMVE